MSLKRIISLLLTGLLLFTSVAVYAEDDVTVPPTEDLPKITEDETPAYDSIVTETPEPPEPPKDNDDEDDDKDDSDSGSGNSSNPGGSNTGNKDKEEDKVEVEIEKPKKDATDEEKEAYREELKDQLDELDKDLESAKDADKTVKAINDSLKEVVKDMDSEDAKEIVKDLSDMVEKAIDNPETSYEEAKEMVTEVIEGTLSSLEDKSEVKEDVSMMIEKVMEKSSEVKPTKTEEGFKASKSQLASAILKVKETKEDLEKTLKKNDMADVVVKETVNLNIETEEEEAVVLTLDTEVTSLLSEESVDLKVAAKGVSFLIPEALLKTASTGLKIESKPVEEADKKSLNKETKSGKATELKTMDLHVSEGDKDVKGLIELSFPLDDVQADLDSLMVGVFENGQWEKLDYKIVNGQVIFTAPHFSIYSLMTYEPSFTDVDKYWGKKFITSLAARGVVAGKSDASYDPNGTLTRAEFVSMLVNHLNLTDEVTRNFKDVEEDKWYYDVVGKAGLNVLSAGTADMAFRPEEAITREEMAAMIYRAYKIKFNENPQASTNTFIDDESIEYKDAVYAVRALEIISGYEDNSFKPQGNATRGEAAVVMYLFMNK
ncbi:hypothetical protein EZV73_05920 [Acidaminobacter sp. JC074]|uniref:S-layer homology domain-containing protein n=1 Tax=Acidaminobacter sp. JC074 TaxID=2530199 RepID=UPI001F0D9A3B|nr:S-layer homology domain-containing protein [Acidaminobacter sp. JC074]MCH4887096.1 hypothetical protein [Acidaminobacter sp. JC074]